MRKELIEHGDIAAALSRGEKLLIVMRHAERYPIDPNDPKHGEDVRLTPKGKKDATDYARYLWEIVKGRTIDFYSGTTLRCFLTGIRFAKVMDIHGFEGKAVLGDQSPFLGSPIEELDFKSAADKFEESLFEIYKKCESDITMFFTHDMNVGGLLLGRNVISLHHSYDWPEYLDAAVIFLKPDGTRSYGYLRALGRPHILPLTYIP